MGFGNIININKKGGIVIFSSVIILSLVLVLVLFPEFVFAATHTADLTLEPDPPIFACDSSVEFTITVTHTGGDPIKEVRIYNDTFEGLHTNIPPHTNFECGDAPEGWVLVDQHQFGFPYCQYQATAGNTLFEDSEQFTFSATLTTESNYAW